MTINMKAALTIFLMLLLAVPMVLPQEEFCAEGDDCCDSPCADCYYNCGCSLSFSALPATSVYFTIVDPFNATDLVVSSAITSPGYVLLPELPPRLA